MADSTHRVEIVAVVPEKHPNADVLSVVKIEGYQVVVRTADWVPSQTEGYAAILNHTLDTLMATPKLGAYIPPDSLVPLDNPLFAFLKDPKKPDATQARVKARKLRGEWSMGLLVPAPPGAKLGDDVAGQFGVTHYDPPEPHENLVTGGLSVAAPKYLRRERKDGKYDTDPFGFDFPTYDVEAFRKYGRKVFEQGEPVWITEKIHGANGRFLFDGKSFYCGTRTRWVARNPDPVSGTERNVWWKALDATPALESFLSSNPGVAVYGEVYGQVQDLKYGTKPKEVRFAAFDILREGRWVNAEEARNIGHILPWVPVILHPGDCEELFTFDFEALLAMAEGPTLVETIPWPGPKHCREGIVIKPLEERWHAKCGRVCLKIVSNEYMERA